jgi:DHA1 family tetracycline resistance protein-like MFS transporter
MPALTSAFAGRAAPHRTGGVLGAQQSASGMARVLGPLAGGFVFDRLGAPSPYLIGAGMMALCAVVLVPRSSG